MSTDVTSLRRVDEPPSQTVSTAGTQRADIQGLRAIAVAAVLLYHLWPHRLTGGFVGVDVFFVISGFLITSHLLCRPVRSVKDLLGFWARRVRRLIPAASVVLLASLVATVVWLPATVHTTVAREVLASTFYLENWVLAWSSTDYLAAEGDGLTGAALLVPVRGGAVLHPVADPAGGRRLVRRQAPVQPPVVPAGGRRDRGAGVVRLVGPPDGHEPARRVLRLHDALLGARHRSGARRVRRLAAATAPPHGSGGPGVVGAGDDRRGRLVLLRLDALPRCCRRPPDARYRDGHRRGSRRPPVRPGARPRPPLGAVARWGLLLALPVALAADRRRAVRAGTPVDLVGEGGPRAGGSAAGRAVEAVGRGPAARRPLDQGAPAQDLRAARGVGPGGRRRRGSAPRQDRGRRTVGGRGGAGRGGARPAVPGRRCRTRQDVRARGGGAGHLAHVRQDRQADRLRRRVLEQPALRAAQDLHLRELGAVRTRGGRRQLARWTLGPGDAPCRRGERVAAHDLPAVKLLHGRRTGRLRRPAGDRRVPRDEPVGGRRGVRRHVRPRRDVRPDVRRAGRGARRPEGRRRSRLVRDGAGPDHGFRHPCPGGPRHPGGQGGRPDVPRDGRGRHERVRHGPRRRDRT
ncbi:acyltransferase [Oerskovia sp. Sa1BUA8]|uniref:Acyltransferase n=1 Tax=Oerskovia douganii TaxID=2762210 RepID=A0A9D5UCT8_9CELL|nr:acyltransferase [Oerskovia douganii]